MEEVDKMIIDSLKALNCDIDDDIVNLKQFQPDNIISALSICLESIKPELKLPKRMPESMSMKLKLATNLVEQIQNVGFRGDIGYQSILYCNDIELRRVLMFLLEHLPRESNKIISTDNMGYVPRLVKEIEEKVKMALHTPWLPSAISDVRVVDNSYLRQSYGRSIPLQTEFVQFPYNFDKTNEDVKNYLIHNLPPITAQCSQPNVFSSILFKDNEFSITDLKSKEFISTPTNSQVDDRFSEILPTLASTSIEETQECEVGTHQSEMETKISNVIMKIKEAKEHYLEVQDDLKKLELKRQQMLERRNNEKDKLKESMNKLNIKSKTLTVLSKEENMNKLKLLVENGNVRLLDLANQWSEVQTPLIEEYKSLKNSLSQQELKMQEEKDKLLNLRERIRQLDEEIAEKEKFEKYLAVECEKINKSNNRAGYTRRILEIIANIKKQDGEINKILKDTKAVQKDIGQLTGQLERSFALCDSLIFADAKQDDVARKAYKLLASLHFDCEAVTESVNEIGQIEREIRTLQDQIDAELVKDIASKLERVNKDIEELRKENEIKQ